MKHLRNKMEQYVERKKGHSTKTTGIKMINKKAAQKMRSC